MASLFLLLTTRPEFHPPWPTLPHHVQIALTRLEKHQARELVHHLGALPERVVDAIVTRTDGVPLFVEELAKAVLEREPTTALAAIPSSLQDSLMARLDRLGPEKQVAQLASVIGREFSRALLEPLALGSPADLDTAHFALPRGALALPAFLMFCAFFVESAAISWTAVFLAFAPSYPVVRWLAGHPLPVGVGWARIGLTFLFLFALFGWFVRIWNASILTSEAIEEEMASTSLDCRRGL